MKRNKSQYREYPVKIICSGTFGTFALSVAGYDTSLRGCKFIDTNNNNKIRESKKKTRAFFMRAKKPARDIYLLLFTYSTCYIRLPPTAYEYDTPIEYRIMKPTKQHHKVDHYAVD